MPNVIAPPDVVSEPTTVIAHVDGWRRIGALTAARRGAEVALSERPYDADLHDALARVLVDAGELQLANDAWETARTLVPGHVGALKGLGFLAFRRGDPRAAAQLLGEAQLRSPSDAGVRGALERLTRNGPTEATQQAGPVRAREPDGAAVVQAPVPILEPAPTKRREVPESFLLLCDVDGLVLAGTLGGLDAGAQRAEVACEVSALATAIARACQHLGLGSWTTCLLEGEDDAYGVGRSGSDALVLSVVHGEGAVGRVLARAHVDAERARAHLGESP